MISSLDDPLHEPGLCGYDRAPANPNIATLLTKHGGHCSFPQGAFPHDFNFLTSTALRAVAAIASIRGGLEDLPALKAGHRVASTGSVAVAPQSQGGFHQHQGTKESGCNAQRPAHLLCPSPLPLPPRPHRLLLRRGPLDCSLSSDEGPEEPAICTLIRMCQKCRIRSRLRVAGRVECTDPGPHRSRRT
jgi:hypothetical protein